MKIPQLTFTRFLAAIAIVIFHFKNEVYPFNLPVIKELTGFLNVLVSYFFVLSGFILAINTNKVINMKRFYFNRFSRIYPVYLFALLFTLLLILDVRPLSFSWDFQRILLSISLLQSWHSKYALVLNYPGWSLSAEAFFYLLFPFIYLFLQRIGFYKKLLIVTFFWLLMQSLFISLPSDQRQLILYNPLFHLSTFTLGVLGGQLYQEKKEWLRSRYLIAKHLLLGLLLVILFLMLTENELFRVIYHNGILAPVFLLSIFIISESNNRLINWFCKPKSEYLGEVSYAIYILQVPVYRFLTQVTTLKTSLTSTVFFYSYLTILLLISIVCYELIEKPSRFFLRSRFYS